MRTAVIIRPPQGLNDDQGTFGTFILDDGWTVRSAELPWRNNEPNISCIPEGEYLCQWTYSYRLSKAKGKDVYTYAVVDVPDRTGIRFHAANFCGDTSIVNPATGRRFIAELSGCIALGMKVGRMSGQNAVLESGIAMAELVKRLDKESFMLQIKREGA